MIEEPRSPMAGNEATQILAAARSCHHEVDKGKRDDPETKGRGHPERLEPEAQGSSWSRGKGKAEDGDTSEGEGGAPPLAALQDPAGASPGTHPAGILLRQEVGSEACLGRSSSPTLTQTRAEKG